MQNQNEAERTRGPRKRARAGGHAPDPESEGPLCGATPQELRFSDPPTCSQCLSVQARRAGVVKKKKNRVKGKHAKGKDGKPVCGVEAKKVYFSKEPSCVGCLAVLGPAASSTEPTKAPPTGKRARAAAKAKARQAKKAEWVIAPCPVCEVPIAEHRLARHMRKIHTAAGRGPDPD